MFVSACECLQARVHACVCECVSGTISVLEWTLLVNVSGIAFEYCYPILSQTRDKKLMDVMHFKIARIYV